MTRLATLSHKRIASPVCVVGLLAVFGCSSSANSTGSNSGGSIAVGTGGASNSSTGGATSLVTTASSVIATGGSSASNTAGGTGPGTSIFPNGGTLSAAAGGGCSGCSETTGGNAATGGTRAQTSSGTTVTTGGTRAQTAGGTHSQATGGVVVQSGGTRAQASSSGGTSATVTTKASGGSSPNATTTVTDAAPSEGCGAAATLSSGAGSITVSGTSREYVLKLPSNYDPQHPYRLIFAFHGRQYTAQSVADGGPPGSGPFYGIESAANGSAIFVAPQALSSSWSNDSDRDVEFVTAMLSLFESKLCIDKNRVFSTGFSMGAIMTIALGCEKADVFRAIAPMSGKVQGTCTGTHAIAYWASHGNSDTTILPKEGEAARDVFVTRDGCSKQTSAGAPQGCVNYVGCDAKYPVTWCTFDGEHEPAPFAGTAIWTFLSQF